MKKKIIVLLGPPGSGKGTIAQHIVESQKDLIKHFSVGSLCRYYAQQETDLGKAIKKTIDNGNLVALSILKILFLDYLANFFNNDKEQNLLLDGFPRTEEQAFLFLEFYESYKNKIDFLFVHFLLDDESIINRLNFRMICSNSSCDVIYSVKDKFSKNVSCLKCCSLLYVRPDDEVNIIKQRLIGYRNQEKNIFEIFEKNNICFFHIDANVVENDLVEKMYNIICSI